MARRMIACLLLMVLVFALPPAAFAEDAAGGISRNAVLREAMAERFGPDAKVETDENGRPAAVNGYPVREVEASFFVRGAEEKFTAGTDFVEYPFWQPATVYDGNLANMSLILALCAARDQQRSGDPETFDPSRNLEAYLRSAGFSDIRKDDYSKVTSIYTISTGMGARRMEHEGEEPFTLIAVGVCGAGYKNEWQSNLTAGTGELHEGFRSASDLVIDRIAGYIATRGIRGRIKIWISGFSRAAAVANLTAGRLTRAGFFAKEDVFAYTYATPAAVLNPPQTGDENIFNILCPTDVVPQVIPADWGFGRYGTDLYLPVQEFSSIGEAAAKQREQLIRDVFGIEVHYSASLNLRMRLLVSMALEVVRDQDNYARNMQRAAVGILQKTDTSSLLSTMRHLLLGVKNSGSETRASLDRLLDFVFRVFGNAVTRTELAAGSRNAGSTLYLLMTEHREDSYLASMDIIRNGVFEDSPDFTYVMVRGPVELELTAAYLPGWSLTLTEQGAVLEKDPETGEITENPEFQEYYMERIGSVSVAAVPKDEDIRVTWKAVSGGTAEVRQALVGLRASVLYPGAGTGPLRVRAGDTGTAWLPEQRYGAIPEGFREETWRAADLTGFLGISAPFVSWRVYVFAVLLLIGLLIFLVLRLVSLFLPNREKKRSRVWLLLALFCVAAAEAEGSFWLLADWPVFRFAWKAAAGAAVLGIFFLRNRGEKGLWRSTLPGLAMAVAADLAMTFSFPAGIALFLLAHALLVFSFLSQTPMNRAQWIQWAVLSALTAGLAALAFVPDFGSYAWAAAAYAPALLLMVYSTSRQTPRIRYAAGFFLLSDLLLGAFLTEVWPDPEAHIACTVLFLASLMLLALGEKKPSC